MDFSEIPIIVLFVITLSSAVLDTVLNAFYIKKKNVNVCDIYLVQVGAGIACAFTLFCLNAFKIKVSTYSLLFGLLFGLITAAAILVNLLAIKKGPLGLTTVIRYCSTAITALSGWLFFSENLTFLKIAGIIFMMACLVLANSKEDGEKKASVIWFILCVVSMILTASIGLMQKTHQNSDYRSELLGFLIIAFVVKTVVSLIVYFIKRKGEIKSGLYKQSEMKINGLFYMLMLMVVCGACTACYNVMNMYLAGVVDSAVFFPIANGVPLMATLIVSFLCFKEKLSKGQVVGFICGLISIVMFTV